MTKEKQLASTPDITKLSYAEMVQLQQQLNDQIAHKRDEELKVLADGYVKKAEAAGFSLQELTDALKPYWSKQGHARKVKSDAAKIVNYRDPADPGNTWSGRGKPSRWLAAYEAQGRKREEFKV